MSNGDTCRFCGDPSLERRIKDLEVELLKYKDGYFFERYQQLEAELQSEIDSRLQAWRENGELRRKVERLEKWQDALRQRLHMAEEQIRECRQYLRLDDRNLVVGHIDAYFALPALNSGEGE